MKMSPLIGAILLLHAYAHADCDAPWLSFPKHSGTLNGFKVTQLFDEGEVGEVTEAQHTVIPFGDYHFSFAHTSGDSIPHPVRSDAQAIARKLSEHFVAGEFHPGGDAQLYSVLVTAAFGESTTGTSPRRWPTIWKRSTRARCGS